MPTCSQCTPEAACGNFHVYVIELRRRVLRREPSFPFDGPLPPGAKVYYVGETSHRVECRYKQHVGARDSRARKHFMCDCFTEAPKKRPFTPHNKPGKFVAKHAKKGGLRPKIFGAQNPVTTQPAKAYAGMQEELKAASRAAEAALAEQLRAAGHAVHYG